MSKVVSGIPDNYRSRHKTHSRRKLDVYPKRSIQARYTLIARFLIKVVISY